jgi:uncharacterized protein YjbI with pentapeptide repeats
MMSDRPFKKTPSNSSGAYQGLSIQMSVLIVCVVAGLLLTVWKIPQWQVGSSPLKVEEKARIDAETSARSALIQGIGGLLFFVTAAVSWRNLKATERNVLVAEDKQVTERFSKAVEMLSNENSLYIRLGGIYALERIAKDSDKEYWQIIEIFTAFVRERTRLIDEQEPYEYKDYYEEFNRENSDDYSNYEDEPEWDGITCIPKPNYIHPCPTDIQAILTALGRRIKTHEHGKQHQLNLSRTDLRGIIFTGDFSGINLEGSNLQWTEFKNVEMIRANLTRANLESAKFEGANLQGADLEGAQMHWAKFISTSFSEANLKDVDFEETSFQRSSLSQADLAKSNFSKAKFCRDTRETLESANLKEVSFSGVDLSEISLKSVKNADLKSVNFSKADLRRADLTRLDLTGADFSGANLMNAKLIGVNLKYANFSAANLANANLTGARVESANFRDTNLTEADLSRARFIRVDLDRANFYQSILAKINVFGVDFQDTQNLTLEQVKSMNSRQQANFPSELSQQLDEPEEATE